MVRHGIDERLLRSICLALSTAPLVSAGCGTRGATNGGDDGGATSNASSGSGSDTGGGDGGDTSEEDAGATHDGGGNEDTDGQTRLDMSEEPEECIDERACGYDLPCIFSDPYPTCPGLVTTDVPWEDLEGFCPRPEGCFLNVDHVCFWPPEGKTCADHGFSDECIAAEYQGGLVYGYGIVLCGPLRASNGACCYGVLSHAAVGRPFTVNQQAMLAEILPLKPSPGADDEPVALNGLSEEAVSGPLESSTVAAYWAAEARAEHASIASFSRFALQLLQLGAPMELLSACARAIDDEAIHAEICVEFARALGHPEIAFGALNVRAGLTGIDFDPVRIATSLASEGCVAETIAASLAAHAVDRARGSARIAKLERIARDEAAHAELAWRALAWLLSLEIDGLRTAVERVFIEAFDHVGLGVPLEADGDSATLQAVAEHGVLTSTERATIAMNTLHAVVFPAAAHLLGWAPLVSASASTTLASSSRSLRIA